jgi:hypothetical protein
MKRNSPCFNFPIFQNGFFFSIVQSWIGNFLGKGVPKLTVLSKKFYGINFGQLIQEKSVKMSLFNLKIKKLEVINSNKSRIKLPTKPISVIIYKNASKYYSILFT